MRRFFLVLEYLGTAWSGWQTQVGHPTIQETLEKVIGQEFDQKVKVVGSGRTDAGVHALGQVAHLDLDTDNTPYSILSRINRRLPDTIYVRNCLEVAPNASAIRDVLWKHYRYIVWRGGFRSPLFSERSWLVPRPLDIPAMRKAMEAFQGTHDFASFAAARRSAKTSVRKIIMSRMEEKPGWLVFDLVGRGFLKHMVRNIVGTVVEVGLGRIPADEIKDILLKLDRKEAGCTAPPQGLTLMSVKYPPPVGTGKMGP